MEEASFIEEYVFKDVILPILRLNRTALVAMSSLQADPNNPFTKLLKCGYFKTYEVKYICDECFADGVRNVCIHLAHKVPVWMGERDGLARALYGEEDEDLLRENMGVMVDATNACFSRSSIERWLALPTIRFDGCPRYTFTSIDPVAGSDISEKRTSDFAVITIASPFTTLLGAEKIDVVRPEDYEGILRSHFQRLRNMYPNAKHIVDAESGTGLEAAHIQSIARSVGNVICIDSFQRKPGTFTSNAKKMDMMTMTRILLDSDDLRTHSDFITHHPNPDKMMKEIGDQFMAYERVVVVGNSVRSKNTVILTGKGANKKKKDDMCVTLQRAILLRHEFMYTSALQKYHR